MYHQISRNKRNSVIVIVGFLAVWLVAGLIIGWLAYGQGGAVAGAIVLGLLGVGAALYAYYFGSATVLAAMGAQPADPERVQELKRRKARNRERGDRGGVGAQDARAERKPHHPRQLQHGGALALGETTFRTDQHRKLRRSVRRPRRRGRERRYRVLHVGLLVAEHQQPRRFEIGSRAFQADPYGKMPSSIYDVAILLRALRNAAVRRSNTRRSRFWSSRIW